VTLALLLLLLIIIIDIDVIMLLLLMNVELLLANLLLGIRCSGAGGQAGDLVIDGGVGVDDSMVR